MSEDDKRRTQGEISVYLGVIAVAAFIFVIVWSIPDWGWTADRFMTAINTWGGYGHGPR